MDDLWIIVMFLSAVWALVMTALIHCRGSFGEQVMECTANFHFWVNYIYIFLRSQVNWSWILRYFYWKIRWKYWPRNWFYFITGRNLLLYVWITLNAAYVESLTWGCFLSYFLKLDMYEYQSPGRIITQFAINTSSKDTWIFVGTGNLYTSCMCHHASILGFWQIIMI